MTLLREVRERAAHEPRIQSPAPSRQMPAAERESALAESLIRAQLRGQTPRAETQ